MRSRPPGHARRSRSSLDYSGGYGKYKQDYWKTFKDTCGAYDGPALAWKVTACKASDGSYWALQSWQRMLPNYGVAAAPIQAVWELRLSHWTGDLPVLTIDTDWAWHQWDHLFGTYSYDNSPVFGFRSTPAGVPLDTFGRNIYVDTFDSTLRRRAGSARTASWLTRTPAPSVTRSTRTASHPSGKGTQYRATVKGPGVTPDVMWQGASPGTYDKALDLEKNSLISQLTTVSAKQTELAHR